ncbi:hypothetical protein ACTWQF_25905 [Streptomyces sp. 8N114]|uniref:hypothetical protein n=1 Tax=Streptomyces sp. 8N114 TaxID=3457419 RepID=UPI003FD203AC
MSGHALAKVTVNSAQDAVDSIDQDWRFAELTAQCCLDPALAVRYAVEPREVLAEFGINADEGTHLPALPAGLGAEVTITSLDPHEAVGHTTDCQTWVPVPVAEPRVPAPPFSPGEPAV